MGPYKTGGNIVAWRESKGLKQYQLAAHTGIRASYLSQIENGDRRVNEDLLELIANVCDCHPSDILRGPPDHPENRLLQAFRHVEVADRRKTLALVETFAGEPPKAAS